MKNNLFICKILVSIVFLSLILSSFGCNRVKYSKYSYETTKAFDTVISFVGYESSESKFKQFAKQGEKRLLELNNLYDIYHTFDGLNNLKTINDNAGKLPVEINKDLMDMLLLSKKYEAITKHKVNIALGAVLKIWHDKREAGIKDPVNAALPVQKTLVEASKHCNINDLVLDEKNMTAFIKDPLMSLDVGSVAKGYATEIVGNELSKAGMKSCIISAGGSNVKLIGSPLDGKRTKWGVGIQDPDSDLSKSTQQLIDTVYLKNTSFVTSGDYQRYYFVGTKRYSHIIDPVTLLPANSYRAVSVLYPDSGVADIFSTMLFIMSYEEGKKFVDSINGLEALWIFPDDHIEATPKLKASMQILGNATGD